MIRKCVRRGLVLSALLIFGSVQAEGIALFSVGRAADVARLDQQGVAKLKQISAEPGLKGGQLVLVNPGALEANSISVRVGELQFDLEKTAIDVGPGDLVSWTGHEAYGNSPSSITWRKGKPSEVTATIRYKNRLFSITPISGQYHYFSEIDLSARPPPERPLSSLPPLQRAAMKAATERALLRSKEAQKGRGSSGERSSQASGPVNINLLVAYTARAAQIVDVQGESKNAVVAMNMVLANSGLSNVRITLVGFVQSAFVESDLDDVSPLQFVMNENSVLAARDSTNADAVIMLADINIGASCGRAETVYATDPALAFADVGSNRTCIEDYGIAHELGHLLGADHDAPDSTNTPTNPFRSFAHGFYYFTDSDHGYIANTSCLYDVMSYSISHIAPAFNCDGGYVETHIPYYSSPSIYISGYSVWVHNPPANSVISDNLSLQIGDSTTNNAAAIAQGAPFISGFHNTKLTWPAKIRAVIGIITSMLNS